MKITEFPPVSPARRTAPKVVFRRAPGYRIGAEWLDSFGWLDALDAPVYRWLDPRSGRLVVIGPDVAARAGMRYAAAETLVVNGRIEVVPLVRMRVAALAEDGVTVLAAVHPVAAGAVVLGSDWRN